MFITYVNAMRTFDVVRSKVFNFNSVSPVLIAKLKTKSSKKD